MVLHPTDMSVVFQQLRNPVSGLQVAIIGRPNVGKSALYNRLTGGRKALVYNTPDGHVTRDYQEARAKIGDLRFMAVDTSGLEPFLPSETIQSRASVLTSRVLQRADVALFLLDGQVGVLPHDKLLAKWLREANYNAGSRVLLVANKCERRKMDGESGVGWVLAEATSLGCGYPVAISAETGEGMADLYEALRPRIDPLIAVHMEEFDCSSKSEEDDRSRDTATGHTAQKNIKIGIMGLTNVGKSTLTNTLVKEDRCLTGPEPGLTRDAISVSLSTPDGGHSIELVDTAGWVRRARLAAHDDVGGRIVESAMGECRTVLRFVHVVALVVDAARAFHLGRGLTHAEEVLASSVVTEGRALVVVANKIDALDAKIAGEALALIRRGVAEAVPDARGCHVLPVSALTGKGIEAFLPAIQECYESWNRRISTSKLNRWLEKVVRPSVATGGGKDVGATKYISQIKSRPPTFVAFVSGGAEFGESSQRFLVNLIKKDFKLAAVPVRLRVRRQLRRRPR